MYGTSESKERLESIGTAATRIVSGATKIFSIETLFDELEWESSHSGAAIKSIN